MKMKVDHFADLNTFSMRVHICFPLSFASKRLDDMRVCSVRRPYHLGRFVRSERSERSERSCQSSTLCGECNTQRVQQHWRASMPKLFESGSKKWHSHLKEPHDTVFPAGEKKNCNSRYKPFGPTANTHWGVWSTNYTQTTTQNGVRSQKVYFTTSQLCNVYIYLSY